MRTISLLRLLIPFMVGICLSFFTQFISPWVAMMLLGIMIIVLSVVATSYQSQKGYYWSGAILVIYILSGFISITILSKKEEPKDLSFTHNNDVLLVVQVEDYPKVANSIAIRGQLLAIDTVTSSDLPKIELYLSKEKNPIPEPSDTIIVTAQIARTVHPDNPYAFDYAAHLAESDIHYQGWTKELIELRHHSRYTGINLIKYGLRTRNLNMLRESLSENSFSIAAALLLGYRNELDKDTQKEFANSGAIHVLAVSGLHVGIIIKLLQWVLLLFRRKSLKSTYLELGFLLAGVWMYVLLTGAGAPVIRAAIIFTLFLIGQQTDRYRNSINILAGAALIMLFIKPSYLFNISFQLSFSAVASIIIFYPYIYRWITSSNVMLRFLWSMAAVSIAAQILIFPISIYYFHQFPSYFIFSSIIAILLAFLIIIIGIIFFAFPHLQVGPISISDVLEGVISALHSIIRYFNTLPHAVIGGVWWDAIQLTIVAIALLAGIVYLYTRLKTFILFTVMSISVFFLYTGTKHIRWNQQVTLSAYEADEGLLDVIIGKTSYEISQKEIHWEKKVFLTKNFRMAHGVDEVKPIDIKEFENLICLEYESL